MAVIIDPGGNKVNTLISANTITTLCDNIKTQAVNCGFSVVSGSSGDWTLVCAATASGGYKARCRLQNGTYGVKIYVQSDIGGGTPASNGETVLFPQTGKDYRFWGNKHMWHCFEENSEVEGYWAMWCQPFVPSHLLATTTEVAFCGSNGGNDNVNGFGGTAGVSFRTYNRIANRAMLYNGVVRSTLNTGVDGIAYPLVTAGVGSQPYRWANGDENLHDALIGFHISAGINLRWQGYMWESYITSGSYLADTISDDNVPGFSVPGRAITGDSAGETSTLWVLDNTTSP